MTDICQHMDINILCCCTFSYALTNVNLCTRTQVSAAMREGGQTDGGGGGISGEIMGKQLEKKFSHDAQNTGVPCCRY